MLPQLPDVQYLQGQGFVCRSIPAGLPPGLGTEHVGEGSLVASPAHLEIGTERIHLWRLAPDALPDAAEAAALCDAAASALGLVLEPIDPECWQLREGAPGELEAVSLPAMQGQSIGPCMPEPRSWHRLMNEIQILWHEHEVNRAREEGGRPSVNALWFWRLPQAADHAPSVGSDDPLVCRMFGLEPLPLTAGAWPEPLPDWLVPSPLQAESWAEGALRDLEHGQLQRVLLATPMQEALELRRKRRWFRPWWRRK
ncbi:MAG: hypothetical protein D6717_12275 [Gammaproteobacteria bacterium]|nr:MAG: hypothetical protein D6717_12275 [Gammaproteobacteria bacterium]